MIDMRGYRVLVKPNKIDNVTESGIIVVLDDPRVEESGQQYGELVGLGPSCWADDPNGPWAKVGDTILYAKFAGRFIIDPHTEEEFMVMNDTDIIAVLQSEKEDNE